MDAEQERRLLILMQQGADGCDRSEKQESLAALKQPNANSPRSTLGDRKKFLEVVGIAP